MRPSLKLTASWGSPSASSGTGSSTRTSTRSAPKTGTSRGSTTYSLGIDPGLGEAGVVLRCGDRVLEFGLVRDHYGAGFPTVLRAQAVAARIVGRVIKWVDRHQIADLDAAVELPVYTSNADGFGKQYATVQAIEAALVSCVAPMLDRMWLFEPIPSESKKAATGKGNATKQEIYDASPFPGMPLMVSGLSKDSLHTLGDAWAHSLTPDHCARRFDARIIWPDPREEIQFEV